MTSLNDEKRSLSTVRLCMLLAAGGFVLALFSLWVSRIPNSVAGYWLANALGVILIAGRPLRQWAVLLAAALFGAGAAGLVFGDPLALLARFALLNGFEVLLGAALLRALVPSFGKTNLSTAVWWRAALIGVVTPSLLTAMLSGLVVAPTLQLKPLQMAFSWFSSGTVGGLSLLAVLCQLRERLADAPRLVPKSSGQVHGVLRYLAVLLLAAILTYLVLQLQPFLFVYVAALAMGAAVLLPASSAQGAIAAISCVLAWGVSAGLGRFEFAGTQNSLNYFAHLFAVLPAIWVSLERQAWTAAREASEAVIDESPSGLAVLSPDGHIVRVNRQAAALLRRAPSDLLGSPWGQHQESETPSEPDELQRDEGPVAPLRAVRLRRGDGSLLDAEISLTPFTNGEQQGQTLVAFSDVSVRRARDLELKQALDQLERLAAIAPGVLCLFRQEPDGRMCMPWQAPQAPAFWGIPSEVLTEDATPVFDRLSPSAALATRERILQSASDLSPFAVEFEYGRKEGVPRWIAVESKPVREPDGAVTWFGFCRDVTEKRRLESERLEQAGRWALAADAGGVGIWQWSVETGLVSVNKRLLAMLGLPAQSEILLLSEFEALFHAEDKLLGLSALPWREKSEGHTLALQTVRMRNGERGGWIWVEARCRLGARGELNGELERVSGTIIDVTERIERDRLRAAHLSAEAASQAKSRFVSRMSHELRTPLNAVLGFAELLEEDPGHTLTDTQHQHVKQVLRSAEHLLSLVNDVLDLSQLEAKELDIVLQPTPVAAVLDEVVSAMMPLARRQQVAIELVACPLEWQVMADRRRLKQALLNLVSNGIKYNRAGGNVRLSVEQQGAPGAEARIFIAVEDTGAGIAPERLESLGEPFNRLGAERSGIAGTGIGLTISKSILASMQGNLQVKSSPGQGSRFTIDLRCAEAAT